MRKTLTITLAALVAHRARGECVGRRDAPNATPKKVIVANKTFTGAHRPGRPLGQRAGDDRRQEDDDHRRRQEDRRSARSPSIKVPVYPNHTDRSVFISDNALPMLVQEALKAQSTHIYIISGATYTSDAFATSLQAAIIKEKAW